MAKKVSIILPTLRANLARQFVLAVERCSPSIDYEIVVVSPFTIVGPRVVSVAELQPCGNVTAHVHGFEAARGDYILHVSDDVLPVPGWLDFVIDRIDQQEQIYSPFILGLQPSWSVFCTVYGYYFANYPAYSRRASQIIGTFSHEFIAHFVDADLSLRAWAAGGRCECSVKPLVYYAALERFFPESSQKQVSLARDAETFIDKWADVYGRGWGRRIEEFNVAHPLSTLADNTFIDPNPPLAQASSGGQRDLPSLLTAAARAAIPLATPSQLYFLSRLIGRYWFGMRV